MCAYIEYSLHFYFGFAHSMQKFLGQELNLCHSSDNATRLPGNSFIVLFNYLKMIFILNGIFFIP